MDFFHHHVNLFKTSLFLFLSLTTMVAILPALHNQEINKALPDAVPLSEEELAGKKIYIDNGCIACHSQQVRNVAMDQVFGSRPSLPADYAGIGRTDVWRNTATLMGTERTGPDLTHIGSRQPSLDWHLLHLYQPRAVVEASIMPAYSWLFDEKEVAGKNDVVVNVPEKFRANSKGKIVATREALQLVAYLRSLKQAPLPREKTAPDFLYSKTLKAVNASAAKDLPDGAALYAENCQSCHQPNGQGLPGAFPPLKGSPVVTGDDLELYVHIIMKGYDPRPEYASMPAVGLNNDLSPEQVTAIINHEKTSWGNQAKPVKVEDVKKIVELIRITEKKP